MRVTATPCAGINLPLSSYAFQLEYESDDAIGEAVGQCIRKMKEVEDNPFEIPNFLVLVTFQP